MQEKTKLITKVALTTLLLVTILSFSNCQKEYSISPQFQNSIALKKEGEKSAATTSSTAPITLDSKNFRPQDGYAYKITESIPDGDTNEEPTQSILKLYENGKEIGTAHSRHDDIGRLGKGRYSHWKSTIILSSSDNTDPRKNGRTYSYVLENPTPAPKPVETPTNNLQASGLMGYAMVNGTTTGGKGGAEVTVTTLSALKSALADNTPRIVYISGTIRGAGEDPVYVKSNKTIIGRSGARLQGIQFYVFGVSNIIFQNIIFRYYVNSSAIQIKEKSHHIWIDHCDFANDKNRGWDYWGKDIAITREADYITVSWNRFHDTNLSVLIGGGVDAASDKGKLRVTLHHNYWYNVSEREPSISWGNVHMFNNYHENNSGYSIGSRSGAIVRTDNEYFFNCKTPLATKVAETDDGYFSGISTNIYDKSGSNKITTSESKWIPTYEYKSYLHSAAQVPSVVKNGAGPK